MKVKSAYDLVIVGDQVSGLLLGTGAAQLGLKVLVLEETSVPSVSYEIPSGKFLGDFLAEPIIGLKEEGAVDHFMRSLGLYQKPEELFPKHEPSLQILGDHFRTDFPFGPDLARTLKRNLGKPEKLPELLSGQHFSRGSFSSAAGDLKLPVFWERFGWLTTSLFGSMASENLSYVSYRELLNAAEQGVRFIKGGKTALKEKLLSRLLFFGGDIKKSARVEQIVFDRDRLAGVMLSSFEGFVRSPRVVGAMSAKRFFDLLPAELRNKKLSHLVGSSSPRFWRLNFTVLIPENLIPEGAGSHIAVFGEEDSLQLQILSKEVYGGIPFGHRALVGRVLVPYEENSLSAKQISIRLKKAYLTIQKHFPFLKGENLPMSPDPFHLETDSLYLKHLKFEGLDFIPPSLLVYESNLGNDHESKVFSDWSKFGLSGVSLCSREVYPLLGFMGEVYAAMDHLATISAQLKREIKKDP